MKLYSYYRSTAAYRVRIALHLKACEYEQQGVHLVVDGGQQHAEIYRKLNPQRLVPTLVDGKTVIGQSSAIIEYLEEKHPEPPLLPRKSEQRAFVRQFYQVIGCDVHPLNNLRVLQYLSRELHMNQEARNQWYFYWLKEGFDALESLATETPYGGKFICGNTVTMAEVFLIPQMYNARRFQFTMDAYPRLMEIENLCLEMEAFEKAHPENQPDTPDDMRPDFLKGNG